MAASVSRDKTSRFSVMGMAGWDENGGLYTYVSEAKQYIRIIKCFINSTYTFIYLLCALRVLRNLYMSLYVCS